MKKFSRRTKHAKNMINNLAQSIIIYEKVLTTSAKAKDACPIVDRAIAIAKDNSLTNQKKLLSLFMHNKNVVKKLIEELGPRFSNTASGFTKIFKYSSRVGDNAPRVYVILAKSKFLNNLTDKINTQNTTVDQNTQTKLSKKAKI